MEGAFFRMGEAVRGLGEAVRPSGTVFGGAVDGEGDLWDERAPAKFAGVGELVLERGSLL